MCRYGQVVGICSHTTLKFGSCNKEAFFLCARIALHAYKQFIAVNTMPFHNSKHIHLKS